MKYYYSYPLQRWLNEDEQSRCDLDYDPQDSRELALEKLREFMATAVLRHVGQAKSRMSELVKSWSVE